MPKIKTILKGDISFVGSELDNTERPEFNRTAIALKPGLTGLEQINSNLDLTMEDRERYHLYYLKNYSLLLDLQILVKAIYKKFIVKKH